MSERMVLLALLLAFQTADRLSALKPFVGGCWRAAFSATVADTHCFQGVYDGAHVRDRHEVREGGKTIYAGETIYSADGPQVVFTYFNSLGGVGHGKLSTEGGRTRFTGTMRASPDKGLEPIDSEWRLVDADHYEVRSLVKGGASPPAKPLIFSRVK
jgi:hypothetical protein